MLINVKLDQRLDPKDFTRATRGSAGVDLRAATDGRIELHPGQQVSIDTGVAIAIPEGFFGLVVPRSGLGTKGLVLANSSGIIDSDFRSTIKVVLLNRNHEGMPFLIEPLDRIAQLLIIPAPVVSFNYVPELDETERGENGFGSTGR